jgi:hypothetical protein
MDSSNLLLSQPQGLLKLVIPFADRIVCLAGHLCCIGQFQGFNPPTSGSLYFASLFSIACTLPICFIFWWGFVKFLTLYLAKFQCFLYACSQRPTHCNMYCSQHSPKITPFVACKCIHEKLQVAFRLEFYFFKSQITPPTSST